MRVCGDHFDGVRESRGIHTVLPSIADIRGLKCRNEIDMLREKVYSCLDDHCKAEHPGDEGRFAQLLLRLPALRSISLKCLDHLFFFRLIGDKALDTFVSEMLDTPMGL